MKKILLSSWESKEKDQETGKKIVIAKNYSYKYGDTIIFETEDIEDGTVTVQSQEPDALKTKQVLSILPEMTKGEFREAIAKGVGAKPEDMDKVNEVLQATNRRMRKEAGGLAYSKQWVEVAIKIYNDGK